MLVCGTPVHTVIKKNLLSPEQGMETEATPVLLMKFRTRCLGEVSTKLEVPLK